MGYKILDASALSSSQKKTDLRLILPGAQRKSEREDCCNATEPREALEIKPRSIDAVRMAGKVTPSCSVGETKNKSSP